MIERYADAWNAHDVDAISSTHHPDVLFHNHTADGLIRRKDVYSTSHRPRELSG